MCQDSQDTRYLETCVPFLSFQTRPYLSCLLVLQTIISQVIIGLRTYTLARYSSRVKYFMIAIFLVTCGLEAFSNYFRRVLLWHDQLCTTGNLPGLMFTFTYYLWAVV